MAASTMRGECSGCGADLGKHEFEGPFMLTGTPYGTGRGRWAAAGVRPPMLACGGALVADDPPAEVRQPTLLPRLPGVLSARPLELTAATWTLLRARVAGAGIPVTFGVAGASGVPSSQLANRSTSVASAT